MVSMRNHDEVIFIDRTNGVQESWTLGENDRFSVLFEQHNPDYIPQSRGGPAVIVADSQNNRVVEYQRQNGSWRRSWTWRDSRMQWPRDADRLPNDHTLIADTNSNRVLEIGRNGTKVWAITQVPGVYDVERLGTGDESLGGWSASATGLRAQEAPSLSPDTGTDDSTENPIVSLIKSVIPRVVLNGLIYVTPWWFDWIGWDGIGVVIAGICLFVVVGRQVTTIVEAVRTRIS